ncbi:SGNH/GDSL hydrolase family protein [Frankia sp. Cpl3]|nr:SGNH/GDSL hydrolase family protein [Frankia sp. Cpl3]
MPTHPFVRGQNHHSDAVDAADGELDSNSPAILGSPRSNSEKIFVGRRKEAMMNVLLRAGVVCVLACGTLIAAVSPGHYNDSSDPIAGAAALSEETTAADPEATTPAVSTRTPARALAAGAYVAMGDSYTAGPRIPSQIGEPGGCDRSDRNYPALIAEQLDISKGDFADVSCSGATIADLSSPQTTRDGVNPAQFTALSAETRLVTIGIGGNDIGFTSLIKQCVRAGVLFNALAGGVSNDAPCKRRYVASGTDRVREQIRAAGQKLAVALDEIPRRAPHADVYLVGYPAILPADGLGCARTMGLANGDITYLRQKELELNTMLQRQADTAGARYIDTYTPSVGHEACSARNTRWIEPLLPLNPAASVHPNERGERGMADAVIRGLCCTGRGGGEPSTFRSSGSTSAPARIRWRPRSSTS